MTDVVALKAANARRWANMHVRAARLPEFKATAERLYASKNRFEGVTDMLIHNGRQPVPWWFTAIISEREYGGPPHWDKQLGQGDPLDHVSTHDPKGRGPFRTWEDGALDALVNCAPFAARWSDWSIGGTLTLWEEYNGLGYAAHGVPSAYVWSGSDQYLAGKFVRDHVFDPKKVDVQEGCAPLLAMLIAVDPTVRFA